MKITCIKLWRLIKLSKKVALTKWTEFELVGFDNINGTLLRSFMKFKRIDTATYGISGRLEVVNDFSNDWQV